MRKWLVVAVVLGLASGVPSAQASGANQTPQCMFPGESEAKRPTLTLDQMRSQALRVPPRVLREPASLRRGAKALAGTAELSLAPLASATPVLELLGDGPAATAVASCAAAPPATPGTGAPSPVKPPAGRNVEAANDVMVFSPHCGFGTIRRGSPHTAANPPVYYAMRYFPTQLARQLFDGATAKPFQIDAVWFYNDNYWGWNANWEFRVVTENATTPYLPNMAPAGTVAGPTTFSSDTYWPTRAGGPTTAVVKQVRVPFPAFPTAPTYPVTGFFAINDKAFDDSFGTTGNLSDGFWLECTGAACSTTTDLKIQTAGQVVNTAAAGQTRYGWRLPDTTGGPPFARYWHDYIADDQMIFHIPDQDLRIDVDYNLSATANAKAGVFFRASRVFPGAGAVTLGNYYSVVLDKAVRAVRVQWTDTAGVATELPGSPISVVFPDTGSLRVEVTGYSPVSISVSLNAGPAQRIGDSTRMFRGEETLGNLFGLIFPGGGGREQFGNFKVRRHADLFTVIKMPVDDATTGAVTMWADGGEESREFFNTFFSTDGGTTFNQTGIGTGADCTKVRNTIVSLQVRDAQGPTNVYQANITPIRLMLPCCGCATDVFDCASAGAVLDGCGSPQTWIPNTRPVYEVGQPIQVDLRVINELAPTYPATTPPSLYMFAWVVCNDADQANPPCTLDQRVCGPAGNCGFASLPLGPGSGVPVPGLNTTVTADQRPADGFPDGPWYLDINVNPPFTWTPAANGDYHIYAFMDAFDLVNNTTGQPPPDGTGDPVSLDDFPANNFIARAFRVGGCTPLTYNFNPKSLMMVRKGTNCLTIDEIDATWSNATLPFDPQTPFNVHEISGRDNLVTALTPCNPCNPWPGTTVALQAIRARQQCVTPPAAANDVVYYTVHQADNCTSASMQDQ